MKTLLAISLLLTACDRDIWFPTKETEMRDLSEYDDYILKMTKDGKVLDVKKEACLTDAENVLCALVFYYEGEPWQWRD